MHSTFSAAAQATPDQLVGMALNVARAEPDQLQIFLEASPIPIYLTDAEGWVTFFNSACINFAGRTPIPGTDRWCVTWRLYTAEGDFLPHELCPMATAIKEGRPVRGIVAAAERPDGIRVMFTPYPTPIVDDEGVLIGAVNLLIDVTEQRQAEALRAQAVRCRRLACSVTDRRTIDTLELMASEYEQKACALAAA